MKFNDKNFFPNFLYLLVAIIISFIFINCTSNKANALISSKTEIVKTGLEVLIANNFSVLKGKNVGLITNPTGVDRHVKSNIDIFAESKEFKLVALYGPEHGVRGDFSAGDHVDNNVDAKTGIQVFSLYGKNRKPNADMLKGIDVLVYDIQDIGCRSYTYISTMGLAMEAAAENNVEFVVLDRPNPLTGNRIEGNKAEEGFISFVSQFKIPYVYGLTCGELAKMLNETGMLKNRSKCKLTVIPMDGWKREMTFTETGLPWVLTSPHIPSKEISFYYVATGVLGELGFISEGVGYTLPFQIFAAEWIDADKLATKLNALKLPGVDFRPMALKPYYGGNKDKNLKGVQLHIYDFNKVNLLSLQFYFLQVHNEMYPEKNPFKTNDKSRFSMFDKVSGSSKIRELFTNNMKYSDIEAYLNKDIESFRKESEPFYLYR